MASTAHETHLRQPGQDGRHVACVLDGSTASLQALPAAREACGEAGRLSVVFADRWASLAMGCPEYAASLEDLREGSEAWLREELGRAGIRGAHVVVLDHPAALAGWTARERPDVIVAVERRGIARLVWGRLPGGLGRAPCTLVAVAAAPGTRRHARRTRALEAPAAAR
jgi:hypothetical protein